MIRLSDLFSKPEQDGPPTRFFLIKVQYEKPIPELVDFIGGRTWTVEGVTDVDVRELL